MSCPHCGASGSSFTSDCPSCGFSLSGLDDRLGGHSVVMNRLVDTQHLLHLRDSVRLETLFDEFERRFPQAFCTVFLGILPHGVSTAEGGFWLLNHGVRTCQDEIRPNDYGIALVIDPSTHSASLCLGYSLETVITHENTAELLRQISPALWHGDYANAITKMVKGVDKLLRKYGQPRRRPSLIDARKPRSLFGFKHTTPEKSPVEVDK